VRHDSVGVDVAFDDRLTVFPLRNRATPSSVYLMSVVKLRHARDQADNPRNGLAGQYGRYEEVTG